jgi:hypothetical protein
MAGVCVSHLILHFYGICVRSLYIEVAKVPRMSPVDDFS